MGSLREHLLEDDHKRALAQIPGSREIAEQNERIDALEKRLQKIEAWIEHEDTRALEESEH